MENSIPTRKSQLSAAKQALLAQRLKGKTQPSSPTIPRRAADAIVPLSFSQQRLWFLYQFEPGNPFYNVPSALHLQGRLDVNALKQALQTLIQRHEILRTTIRDGDRDGNGVSSPQQVIHAEGAVTLQQIDLSPLGDRTWSEMEQLAAVEAHRPFDLRQGPLLRVTLLTLAEQDYVLLVTLHHIISDVWSAGVLVREMALLYQAFTQGKPSPLSPLPIQYADFTLWQRQRLQGDYVDTQLGYWQQQFTPLPPVLQLPTDRPRPVVQSFCGDHRSFSLPAGLTQGLKVLGQASGTTLFMTLLAAFKVLLYRWTGQTDIIVGSPIANRNQAATEGLMGLFMNTLALRTQLSGDLSFQALLERVRDMALGAYSHQDLPFERLVEALQLPRDLSHSPLFQVMVILQNAPSPTLNLPDLTLRSLELPNRTAKLDLTLVITEVDGQLQGVLEYNTDLFEAATIDRLVGHFQTLLTAIVANPETRLCHLPLLTASESIQLRQWAQAETCEIPPLCLHQLFEAQVEKTPDEIAIVFGQSSLTYNELNQRANQLARHLQALGVGPETLVSICVERSLAIVVGLLAILKAGGAYVPVDPNYPQGRLQFMLQDAQGPVLLTQASLLEQLPQQSAQVFCLDRDWPLVAAHCSLNLNVEVIPDNVAYVIYTSGSTGRPKGVMNCHGGICNRLLWMQEAYGLTPKDRVLQKTPFSFDVSVWEFFWPLLAGARLIVAKPEGHKDSHYLIDLMVQQQVTTVHFVPSMLTAFLKDSGVNRLTDLKRVICSGEALSMQLQRDFFAHLNCELHNLYGPTEAAIDVTAWPCRAGSTDTSVPIGYPIRNIQTYILDTHLQPVPVGVSGELHIGGIGVARGYLNRPVLSQEKFIPNPFGEGRLYKTGDRVRYRPDGAIEYLGRLDHQVKIRGFRIELGEIEAVLQQQDQVQEAVAIAREDKPGQKQLVAYLVSSPSIPEKALVSLSDLRQELLSRLPDYMVPTAFVWLNQIPLTPNGKIDRKALPAPHVDRASLTASFTAPRSQLEQQLATIWGNVLDVDTIGIDDNFFELGGDSILSLQIIAQADQAGLQVTPKQLFQHQTIRTLAAVVETVESALPDQGPVVGTVALTPLQQHFFATAIDYAHWHQSLCLDLLQPLTLPDLRAVVWHLLTHHDALRLCFQIQDDGWVQYNRPPMASLDSLPDDVVYEVMLPDADVDSAIAHFQETIDLAVGPLLRVVLLCPAAVAPLRLLLITHPLLMDGPSWNILIEDLQTLLQQHCQGQLLQLPPKTLSFQQWAQRLQAELVPPPMKPLSPLPEEPAAKLVTVLPANETQTLLQQVSLAYRTETVEVLLTALVQTLTCPGTPSVRVDIACNGRESPLAALAGADAARTMGAFSLLSSGQLDLAGIDGPGEALKAIKEQRRTLIGGTVPPQSPADTYFSYDEPLAIPAADPPWIRIQEAPITHRGRQRSAYALYLESRVVAGQLYLCWTAQKAPHQLPLEPLAQTFLTHLRSLIQHCLEPGAGGYTPSDFPLAPLDQATLDTLPAHHPPIEDCYPLAPIQQGFLFHTLYTPDDGLYVTQICCRIQGDLDVAALRQTWQLISDRHPILRTAFVWEELPQPLQVVYETVAVPWQMHDWRSRSPSAQQAELAALQQRDRTAGFPPHQAPLMRPILIQLTDDTFDIIWSCHHMLLDGWSMPMVIQEIFTLYEGLRQGQPPALESRRPYRDYIAWLADQDLAAATEFWTTLLCGFRSPTPLGYQRVAGLSPQHEIQGLTVEASLAAAIQMLAQRYHLTLNTLVQGVWAVMLGHIGGETDVIFGATTAGRPPTLPGADRMIGLFINTLPVRVQLLAESPLSDWLQTIQTQQSQARQYEYSPLNQIQRWSEVPSGTPLFESLIVFENYRVDPGLQSPKIQVEVEPVHTVRNNNYPLTVRVLPRAELVVQIMSDRTCFAAETTQRWLQHLQALLQWLVEHPEDTVGDWQAHLTSLERQWQQQQAQTLKQSSRQQLRKTRRKAVHPSAQETS